LLFFAAFCPKSTTYQPIWNYVPETASKNLLMSLLILLLLQHSSTAHFLLSPSASSTFNSLSLKGVASPPAMPEDTYQNY
jgi:hypothetical protein